MLHPILQEVRRRGIITAIGTQPELVRVRDTHGVTGVHANQRVFERGGEIRRPFAPRVLDRAASPNCLLPFQPGRSALNPPRDCDITRAHG